MIVFTDGMDVGSYNSPQQVIDIVSQYSISVFIVRIGDSYSSAEDDMLRRIAEASGGRFKNLSEFSSDMNQFYSQIYRQMKEYYVVEYDVSGIDGLNQTKEFSVYAQNQEKGGETLLEAEPGKELFDSLLGSYLRSHIHDMNQHQYDQIRKYVDNTVDPNDQWSIQWQIQKQVTGDLSDVIAETLMNYSVLDITIEDENTVRLKSSENYEVVYDKLCGDLKQSNQLMAKGAMEYLEKNYAGLRLQDDTKVRVWERIN